MADNTSDPTNQTGNEQTAATPSELNLKRHGKEHKVPLDKAVDLAQKGLDYEMRLTELRQREEGLKADQRAYDEYKRLRDYLSANPAAKQAVAFAIENPDRVVEITKKRTERREVDLDDDDDEPTPREDPRVGQLEAELASLKERLNTRDKSEAKSRVEKSIRAELESYPWLSKAERELAFKQVSLQMAQTPDESLSAVAAMVASDFKDAWEEKSKANLERQKRTNEFRTERPSRGLPPTVGKPEKLTKEAWRNGTLVKEGMRIAREMGFAD